MKVQKLFYLDLEILVKLDKYCKDNHLRYSRVVQRAIYELLKKEGGMK